MRNIISRLLGRRAAAPLSGNPATPPCPDCGQTAVQWRDWAGDLDYCPACGLVLPDADAPPTALRRRVSRVAGMVLRALLLLAFLAFALTPLTFLLYFLIFGMPPEEPPPPGPLGGYWER